MNIGREEKAERNGATCDLSREKFQKKGTRTFTDKTCTKDFKKRLKQNKKKTNEKEIISLPNIFHFSNQVGFILQFFKFRSIFMCNLRVRNRNRPKKKKKKINQMHHHWILQFHLTICVDPSTNSIVFCKKHAATSTPSLTRERSNV